MTGFAATGKSDNVAPPVRLAAFAENRAKPVIQLFRPLAILLAQDAPLNYMFTTVLRILIVITYKFQG